MPVLTEEQVARAKREGWEAAAPSMQLLAYSAPVEEAGYAAVFVGGPLDGQTIRVASFAPTRLVRLGGKTPGKPEAFKGGTAPPGRWAVYDVRASDGAEVPVYDFKRERGRA